MRVMEAQDACPHTQVSYLSGAAMLGTPSAVCSAEKCRDLALSSGLRLWAAEQGKNTGQPWPLLGERQAESLCGLNICVFANRLIPMLEYYPPR